MFDCGVAPLARECTAAGPEFVSRVTGVATSEVEVVADSVPTGVPVSSSGTTGDRFDCAIEGDNGVSLRTGIGFVSGEKNVVTNVYSAVVLSIRTRSADRSSDSMGAFC